MRRTDIKSAPIHTTPKQHFVLRVSPYKTAVSVFINGTEADVLRAHRKESRGLLDELGREISGWDRDEHSKGRMCPVQFNYFVLMRLNDSRGCEAIGIIVHEMTHAMQRILQDRGVPLTQDTEEAQAYLVEHLVVETLKRLRT